MDYEKSKKEFELKIWNYCVENKKTNLYPKWMLREFCDYWTQVNDNGRKMYWQMEKRWSTGGRLATWKRNSKNDWRNKEKWTAFEKAKPSVYKPSFSRPANEYVNPDYEAYKRRKREQPSEIKSLGQRIKDQLYGQQG